MKQWWMVPGQIGAVTELREVGVPTPGPGQVLVRMAGAGVNRGELISGRLLRVDDPKARPMPSGIEIAGIVETVGDGVKTWETGARVMARGAACHAEFALLDATALMPSPAGFSDIEHEMIRDEAVFDTAAIRALYGSYSIMRDVAPERAEAFLDRLAEIVETDFGGQIRRTCVMPVYTARKCGDGQT